MRKILRRTSTITYKQKPDKLLKHKNHIAPSVPRLHKSTDRFDGLTIDELVKLCGASTLYLPADYSPGTLRIPTCLRATAQYLIQHGKPVKVSNVQTRIANMEPSGNPKYFQPPRIEEDR